MNIVPTWLEIDQDNLCMKFPVLYIDFSSLNHSFWVQVVLHTELLNLGTFSKCANSDTVHYYSRKTVADRQTYAYHNKYC